MKKQKNKAAQFPTMYGRTARADRICIRRTGRAVTIAG